MNNNVKENGGLALNAPNWMAKLSVDGPVWQDKLFSTFALYATDPSSQLLGSPSHPLFHITVRPLSQTLSLPPITGYLALTCSSVPTTCSTTMTPCLIAMTGQ